MSYRKLSSYDCRQGNPKAMEQAKRQQAIARIKEGMRQALAGLIDREAVAQLILLGAIAQEHLLIIGPPGTAKSYVVKRVATIVGGSYFEYLLGKFTEPSELFGTIDFTKLQDGRFETQTEGMLPEADFVFLDEIFLASTAILNTLLGVLNDHTFRRGHTQTQCPLKICVGASNQLPEDETLQAFSDRFLLTYFIQPVADPQLETLLSNGWSLSQSAPLESMGLLEDIEALKRSLPHINLTRVVPQLAEAIRRLRQNNIILSDRRLTKLPKLVAASALLAGREIAESADLWPLVYAVQKPAQQEMAQQILEAHLEVGQHSLFAEAANEAAGTLDSLESVLINRCEQLLMTYHNKPPESAQREEQTLGEWRNQTETLLKEIDAGFAAEQRCEKLSDLRQQLISLTEQFPAERVPNEQLPEDLARFGEPVPS